MFHYAAFSALQIANIFLYVRYCVATQDVRTTRFMNPVDALQQAQLHSNFRHNLSSVLSRGILPGHPLHMVVDDSLSPYSGIRRLLKMKPFCTEGTSKLSLERNNSEYLPPGKLGLRNLQWISHAIKLFVLSFPFAKEALRFKSL